MTLEREPDLDIILTENKSLPSQAKPKDPFEHEQLSGGFGGNKYRGNHRSHVRGKGIEAFFRDRWMRRYWSKL